MQQVIAFRRLTTEEKPVTEQLQKWLEENRARVVGFQMLKEKPAAVEEYLMAVVEGE